MSIFRKGGLPLAGVGLAVALIIATAIYWPGLYGPLLFDDYWVLTPVEKWHDGILSWRQALLPVPGSIVTSRPLAMASFMASMEAGGPGAFPAKLGNLFLHLCCGVLVWWVSVRLLSLDRRLAPYAALLAILITTVWLIHPLQVSTVLYAVQRMSQLSAIFVLASVAVYLAARTQLEAGRTRPACLNLFLTFPLLVAVGLLSKQNAIVAPILCGVIELAFPTSSTKGRQVRTVFFTAFIALPAAIVTGVLVFRPELVFAGYQDWDFTPAQRLLTQPRVLIHYMSMLTVPYSPAMGLYTDDFPIFKSLFSPPSTIPALLALIAASAMMWKLRRQGPSLFAGWFMFLGAHSVEASFLPLEVYYEHRNYLPSVGFFLFLCGLGSLLSPIVSGSNGRLVRGAPVAATALVVVLGVATVGRVQVWQDHESIIEQGYVHHPLSMRAASDMISLRLDRNDAEGAIGAATPLTASADRRARIYGRLYLVALDCRRGLPLNTYQLDLAVTEALPKLTVYEVQMFKFIDNASNFGKCRGRAEVRLADALSALVEAATEQSETSPNKYVSRDIIARLYARGGEWEKAEEQAATSWRAGGHAPTGAMLVRMYEHLGESDEAWALLYELEAVVDPDDVGARKEIRSLRELLGGAH